MSVRNDIVDRTSQAQRVAKSTFSAFGWQLKPEVTGADHADQYS
ncbi:hypothetical protein [Endozoicomonas sp. SESOKO1]|nr:hypothetical protein [Endozoicomonas sp. SESOKO1]